jgi:hypothetical protein
VAFQSIDTRALTFENFFLASGAVAGQEILNLFRDPAPPAEQHFQQPPAPGPAGASAAEEEASCKGSKPGKKGGKKGFKTDTDISAVGYKERDLQAFD